MSRDIRVLRHEPKLLDLLVDAHDAQGWVDYLLMKTGRGLLGSQLLEIVKANGKKRFTISKDERPKAIPPRTAC